jgi:hypothetical protein
VIEDTEVILNELNEKYQLKYFPGTNGRSREVLE